jgi:hypothetical protein
MLGLFLPFFLPQHNTNEISDTPSASRSNIIAIQPNVPMSGLTEEKWSALRKKHVELSETALSEIKEQRTKNEGGSWGLSTQPASSPAPAISSSSTVEIAPTMSGEVTEC